MDQNHLQTAAASLSRMSKSAPPFTGKLSHDEIYVDIEDVRVGMHILRLDIPWERTRFLFQGFLVQDESHISELRRIAKYAIISRKLSEVDALKGFVTEGSPFPESKRRVIRDMPSVQRLREQIIAHKERPDDAFSLKRFLKDVAGLFWFRQPSKTIRPSISRSIRTQDHRLEQAAEVIRFKDSAKLRKQFAEVDQVSDEIILYQDSTPIEDEVRVAKTVKTKLEETIPDLANEMAVAAIAKNIDYSMQTLTEVADSILRNPGAMQLVNGVKAKDKEAHQHALDAAMLLISFGRELGLPKRDIIDLGMGGLLHDVGMTRVLGGVFNTRKVRSATEYKIYKEHVKEGIQAIKEIGIESQVVKSIVANHHERYDGTGFPRGIKKDAIGMYGNMAVIVDAYVSMVSGHGINIPMTPSQAINELLNNAGKLYHPSLLNQFIQIIGVYPVGSIIRLNNGQTGLVVKQNRLWRLSPVILVILDEKKKRLRIQKLIDLKAPENAAFKIVRELPVGYPGILPEDYHFG